ncbi:uncharacterized protein LOC130992600 [Salvia miltiorrhiza]|uniref:uncharacterized protein LOC130992600 n=1 Tax=Salvia miltiorrhiza TaxID=226208 RepID=UPI0025AD2E73|nr:uncharacterized protein LOC130992600 [Salvia miltiorrhiza]
MEWFDDTSSSSSDEVAQVIIDEIQEQKQFIAQMYSQPEPKRVVHHRHYVYRDREAAHLCLMQDYFNDNPTYGPIFFRRRFRMQKELVLHIVDAVQDEDTYFQMSYDARGRNSLTPLQKCTVAIRQLAFGVSADTFDEYLKIADTTGRLCLKKFCKAVIQAYAANVVGSNNDINILNQSPLFSDVLDGTAALVIFEANRRYYQMSYYLCDSIYPEWRCFVKSPPMVINPKEERFKKMQESAWKDVECAFGVLQARWGIIRSLARGWYVEYLKDIMMCCIILRNMIIENEGERATHWRDDDTGHVASSSDSTESVRATPVCFEQYVHRDALLRDRHMHAQLQNDLIEHVWARFEPLGSE